MDFMWISEVKLPTFTKKNKTHMSQQWFFSTAPNDVNLFALLLKADKCIGESSDKNGVWSTVKGNFESFGVPN